MSFATPSLWYWIIFRPTRAFAQMVPDWNNPRKIGLLFEAKVGNGKLLMSSVDFWQPRARPVAKHFLCSIQSYAASDAFQPERETSVDMIDKLSKP